MNEEWSSPFLIQVRMFLCDMERHLMCHTLPRALRGLGYKQQTRPLLQARNEHTATCKNL